MKKRKSSLKVQLLGAFVLTSILPVILVNLFLLYNTSGIIKENNQELTYKNLLQTRSSLDVWIESYEDILYQIYTDDDIVALVDRINQGEDVSVSKNQLRRTLHGLFYTKEYIKSITILTENGTQVFYDMLTGSSTQNSWLDNLSFSRNELYEMVAADNDTHILSTQQAIQFGGENHYLFHLGHRIIDYRNVDRQIGIVVVSVDEELLSSVCTGEKDTERGFNFIVDAQGAIVSYPKQEFLTRTITGLETYEEDPEYRKNCYEAFVHTEDVGEKTHILVTCVHDDTFDWDIINVSSQEETMQKLNGQQRIFWIVMCVSLTTLILMIIVLIRRLTSALQDMASVMKKAGLGELSARVRTDGQMPLEVETIAVEFNHMLGMLSDSMDKERKALEKQRHAEIAALESQMNPHFLYNTLDTINWLAIDQEEYEISNSINALAEILRYGLDNSNGTVTIQEEYEWLKKYLFLQQTRMKNKFECEIHIAPEVMQYRIHKLLLQPFVENALLHGFDRRSSENNSGAENTLSLSGSRNRTDQLIISVSEEKEMLKIRIYDNGKGMPQELVDQINQGIFPKTTEKSHIGMENAISRIHMYYGAQGRVQLQSTENMFTCVEIEIPYEKEGLLDTLDKGAQR